MKSGISLVASMILLTIFVTTQSGCGNNGQDLKDVYSNNMKRLYGCYNLYMEEHEFKGPKDEAELKNYLKTDPTAIYLIKRIDLTPETVDDIFISERDGEPFVVRYGLSGVADFAMIFEKTGVDGMRLIALADPKEYDSATYDDYLSGKIEPEYAEGNEFSTTENAEEENQKATD